MDYVELAKALGEGAQPERLFPATGAGNMRDEVAESRNAAGVVSQIVELVGGSGVAEDSDVDAIAQPTVDLVSPAGEGASVIGTELLAAGEQDADFEG